MTGRAADGGPGHEAAGEEFEPARFAELLEDSVEDLYDNAPCGYLSTLLDGRIAKVNATLLDWLGYTRAQLVGRRRFADLLTVGGRIYHETHFAPLLTMQNQVSGIALELTGADGGPIQSANLNATVHTMDIASLEPEQRDQLRSVLLAIKAQHERDSEEQATSS